MHVRCSALTINYFHFFPRPYVVVDSSEDDAYLGQNIHHRYAIKLSSRKISTVTLRNANYSEDVSFIIS